MGVTRFESSVVAQTVGTADVDKLAASFEKLSGSIDSAAAKSKKVSEHPGFEAFAEKIKAGIQNPMQAGGEAIEGLLTKLGPVGVGLAAGAGAIAIYAKSAMDFARELGGMGDAIEDTGVRMGLTNREVQEFSLAMKLAGGDMGGLEGTMRKLSQEIDDGGQNLHKLGVRFRDVNTGAVLPMSGIILQLSERLNSMTDVTKRNAAAVDVLGKGALAVLPDLLELPSAMSKATDAGLVFTDQTLGEFNKLREQMVLVDAQWDFLATKLKQGIAMPILWFFGKQPAGSSDAFDMARAGRGVPVQPDRFAEDAHRFLSGELSRQGLLYAPGAESSSGAFLRGQVDTQIAAIDRNDRAVAAARAGGETDQLTAARKKLEELRKGLLTGVMPEVNTAALAEIATQEKQIKAIEWRIEATKKLADAEKALVTFERQMSEKDLGPISRIFAQRDDLVAQGANRGRATDAALLGAMPELAKMTTEYQKTTADIASKSGEYFSKSIESVVKTAENSTTRLFNDMLAKLRAANEVAKQLGDIETGEKREKLLAGAERAVRLAELRAGPGQEVGVINTSYEVRVNLAQQIHDLEIDVARRRKDQVEIARVEGALRIQMLDAEIDRQLRLEELQRRRLDTLRNEAGQFFDALLQGPQGVKQFFSSLAMGEVRKVFQNLVVEEMGGLSANIGLKGKIFQGTIFGQDALKDQAALKLSTAGGQLSMAAGELMGAARAIAMAPGSGGGSFGGGGGGIYTGGAEMEGIGGDFPISGEDLAAIHGSYGMGSTPAAASGFNWRRAAGIGTAVAAGGYGIYSGARSGGLRGGLTAGASAAGLIGAVLPLVSKALAVAGPIGQIAAIGMGLMTSFLPDPKVSRDREMEERLLAARYLAPTPTQYSADRYGRGFDADTAGNVRPLQVVFNVNAIDAKSVVDRADDFADALSVAIESRRSPRLASAIRNVTYRR